MLVTPTTGKPRVILGTMTFGPDPENGARVTSLDEYNKALDLLQSQGYNEIDTARAYVGGKQEAWTKSAQYEKRGLTLATKCYPKEPGQHLPENILASLDKSLAELGTNCVDIFYLHAAEYVGIPSYWLYLVFSYSTDANIAVQCPLPKPSRPSTKPTRPASSSSLVSPISPPLRSQRWS